MIPVRPDEWDLLLPLVGSSMLELGNKVNSRTKVSYKSFFEGMGISHTSIDWNGLDGAIKLDLTKRIWDKFQPFDMVTNIGTTEHVYDQRAVWDNVHRLIKPGGLLISVTPYRGSWKTHGKHYPEKEFFVQFAELNGYRIERLYVGKEKPTECLYARLKKRDHDNEFVMPEEATIYDNGNH